MAAAQLGFPATGPFGLGCAPLGNLFHAISDEEANAVLEAAWAAGVRWFDTAPHYGLGVSERRLGAFLKHKPRGEYIVSTKVGRRLIPVPGPIHHKDDAGFDVPATHRRLWDFTASGVEETLAASLERMQLEHIDIVLLHDPSEHLEDAIRGATPALRQLQADGVVSAIGAGSRDLDALSRLVTEARLDVVMAAGRYSLLDQEADDVLFPLCLASGVAVVNVGVFNSGILASAEPPDDASFEYRQAGPELATARRIAEVCGRHGTSLPAAALAFSRRHPAIQAIAVGAASVDELITDVSLVEAPPPAALWVDLVREGLLSNRHVRYLLDPAAEN